VESLGGLVIGGESLRKTAERLEYLGAAGADDDIIKGYRLAVSS